MIKTKIKKTCLVVGGAGFIGSNLVDKLIELGYINQLLVSLDICKKMDLNKYGGRGYNHIQKYVVPIMLRQGMTRKHINNILIDNPRRILCFV